MRTIRSLILVLGSLAACSGPSPASPASPAAAPTSTQGSTPAATPSGSEVSLNASTLDGLGDLIDQDDKAVDGHGYVDVVALEAALGGERLRLVLRTPEQAPRVPDVQLSLTYTFVLEVTGDEDFDYWIIVENTDTGGWIPSISDWARDGETASGDQFPGTYAVEGGLVAATVNAEAIREGRIRLCAITQALDAEGNVIAEDHVPGGRCPADATYLELGP